MLQDRLSIKKSKNMVNFKELHYNITMIGTVKKVKAQIVYMISTNKALP